MTIEIRHCDVFREISEPNIPVEIATSLKAFASTMPFEFKRSALRYTYYAAW